MSDGVMVGLQQWQRIALAPCEIVTIAIADKAIHRVIELRSQPRIYHLRTRAIARCTDNMGVLWQVISKILDVVLRL